MVRRSLAVRFVALGALLALGAPVLAGCARGPQDAATVGDDRVDRAAFEDSVAAATADPAFTALFGAGEQAAAGVSADARLTAVLLSREIQEQATKRELETRGLEVTDANRRAARTAVEGANGIPDFARLSARHQREIIESEARFAALQAAIAEEPVPGPEEYFRTYREAIASAVCPAGLWVSHILVATEAEAQAVLRALRSEDFAVVAAERSTDTASAVNGGALGCLQAGQLVPEFEQAARAATVGRPTGPVETQFGWHVILRTDTPTYAAVAPQISQVLADPRQVPSTTARLVLLQRMAESDVWVNARFGIWDAIALAVTPTPAPDVREGRQPTTAPPASPVG